MKNSRLIVLALTLAAALALFITACSKPADVTLYDTDPEPAAADKAETPAMEKLDAEAAPVGANDIDSFEYPVENRTENQLLPDFADVRNGLDMCTVVCFNDLDDLLAQRFQEDGAIVTGRKISCVSYRKYEGRKYLEGSDGIYSDITRYYTITRFLVEKVAEGQGIEEGDIITIIEDYSFLDDGSAYQMAPLYSPPIYEGEEYLIIISPDKHDHINVEGAWDVRSAILIDEFSRNYEQYNFEERLAFRSKRGYFHNLAIAKEAIERFADGK